MKSQAHSPIHRIIKSANLNHLNGSNSGVQFRIRKTHHQVLLGSGGANLVRPATTNTNINPRGGDEGAIRSLNHGQIQGGFSEQREDEDMERGTLHIEEIKQPLTSS